jgi:hypothetical protein
MFLATPDIKLTANRLNAVASDKWLVTGDVGRGSRVSGVAEKSRIVCLSRVVVSEEWLVTSEVGASSSRHSPPVTDH